MNTYNAAMFPVLDEKNTRKILIALALYLTSLVASNTLGLKIMPFVFGLHLSVGVFCFPVVFIMTDVIGEVYGKRMARLFVLCGAVTTILFILYSLLSIVMPWDAAGLWVRDGYNQVFGISIRIAIASVIAFVIGEYQDVLAFFFFKAKTGARFFWLRSTLSNLWSQLFDTTLFMTIAFYGVYANPTLLRIIVTWWLFKVLMGIAYLPLSYFGIWLLRDEKTTPATA